MKTEIFVISGFLGAGKTTLIQKLLKEAFSTPTRYNCKANPLYFLYTSFFGGLHILPIGVMLSAIIQVFVPQRFIERRLLSIPWLGIVSTYYAFGGNAKAAMRVLTCIF